VANQLTLEDHLRHTSKSVTSDNDPVRLSFKESTTAKNSLLRFVKQFFWSGAIVLSRIKMSFDDQRLKPSQKSAITSVGFFNRVRRHNTCGGVSPVEFEKRQFQ
jgi:hypothetical protein